MSALRVVAILALAAVFLASFVENAVVRGPSAYNALDKHEKLRPRFRAVNSSVVLEALRQKMRAANLSAYIITSGDDHQSEYVANHDKRRQYVSGFTGSAGDAVVTLTSAALWTDSRYYLQAEEQLDSNWELIKTTPPSIPDWLKAQLQPGDAVSADSRIVTYRQWTSWNTSLADGDLTLKVVDENLVDTVWRDDGQPPYPADPVFVLDVVYTGETWQERIARVRSAIAPLGDVFVFTALDEVAWALNLRGADIPFTPLFRSYLVVSQTDCTLYVPAEKVTPEVENHLAGDGDGMSVSIKNYEDIWQDLPAIGLMGVKIILASPYSYAGGASYHVYSLLPSSQVAFAVSPILSMKDTKNSVEAQGMRDAHVRDAVALSMFFNRIETEVIGGVLWGEMSALAMLDEMRTRQNLSMGPSFETISAFGPNSALPHYESTPETDVRIDNSSVYMVDSGGQYLDGTTDVTRTVHFGTPTSFQQEAYTRLLMGCINLCSTKFPAGKEMRELEIMLRAPLYEAGLDYGHGSTHGIGAFGGVHEAFNTTYHAYFFGSQEPGYYRDHEFGMRLENIVTVVEADLPESGNTTFFTFEPVTLFPYYRKLIIKEMMTAKQLTWLNEYHDKVFQTVGEEMKRQGFTEATSFYRWLQENTLPI